MLRRWIGPLVTLIIVGGVGAILLLNLEIPKRRSPSFFGPSPADVSQQQPVLKAGFREYPIGAAAEHNHMRIAAVWLPSVEVEGLNVKMGSDVIHLEADIHATEGNPNGFALGEFVPYLKISYRIVPGDGGNPLEGKMMPMVASDGPHYGASLSLPKAGKYRLTYHIDPPSAGGLGRHHDPITGVAPWWEPFEVSFDWDYHGPIVSNER